MIFRDDYERKAHDIICIVKYGATGGIVATRDVRRVGDILRGHSLDPPKLKVAVPLVAKVALPNLAVTKLPEVTIPIKIDITPP